MEFLYGFMRGNELNLYQEKNCLNIKKTLSPRRGRYRNNLFNVWLVYLWKPTRKHIISIGFFLLLALDMTR